MRWTMIDLRTHGELGTVRGDTYAEGLKRANQHYPGLRIILRYPIVATEEKPCAPSKRKSSSRKASSKR